jgi:MacB-like periplasmic core domain
MLWKRLGDLLPWRRRAAEQEIDEELRAIAAMAQPGELGSLTLAAENARSELGWTRLEQAGQDLRYAVRSAKTSPGFTAAAVASLSASIVYPRYFATMGIPVVLGRDFNEDDLRPGSPKVVIVNEAFVRTVLGGASALGTEHGLSEGGRGAQRTPMNIVGVVKDTRFPALREAARPLVYQPYLQANTGFGGMTLHVRLSEIREATVRQIREAAQAVQPDVPMFQMHSLAEEVDAALVRERLVATLSGVFGIVALVLICVGRWRVTRSACCSSASALLALVTLAAVVLPALRASRVDPIIALGHE